MNLTTIPGFEPWAESALVRFDPQFVELYGKDSLFVCGLADLWTVAMHNLLAAPRGKSTSPAVRIGDNAALAQVSGLVRSSEILQVALFQEPFGFVGQGAIASAFESTFVGKSFPAWLAAFQRAQYGQCAKITNTTA
jgi:hypothetical protein